MRVFRRVVTRETVTGLLAVTAAALAVAYAIPGLGVSTVMPAGRLSITARLGPLYVVLFALCAVLLAAGAWSQRRRLLIAGHVAGAAASGGWAFALGFGALASKPVGSIVTAVVAIALVVLHVWCAVDYGTDAGGDDDDDSTSR